MVHFKQQHIFLWVADRFLCHPQKAFHVAERVKEKKTGMQLVQHLRGTFNEWDTKC